MSSRRRRACPACGRSIALRHDGLVRTHHTPDHPTPCAGSGTVITYWNEEP